MVGLILPLKLLLLRLHGEVHLIKQLRIQQAVHPRRVLQCLPYTYRFRLIHILRK